MHTNTRKNKALNLHDWERAEAEAIDCIDSAIASKDQERILQSIFYFLKCGWFQLHFLDSNQRNEKIELLKTKLRTVLKSTDIIDKFLGNFKSFVHDVLVYPKDQDEEMQKLIIKFSSDCVTMGNKEIKGDSNAICASTYFDIANEFAKHNIHTNFSETAESFKRKEQSAMMRVILKNEIQLAKDEKEYFTKMTSYAAKLSEDVLPLSEQIRNLSEIVDVVSNYFQKYYPITPHPDLLNFLISFVTDPKFTLSTDEFIQNEKEKFVIESIISYCHKIYFLPNVCIEIRNILLTLVEAYIKNKINCDLAKSMLVKYHKKAESLTPDFEISQRFEKLHIRSVRYYDITDFAATLSVYHQIIELLLSIKEDEYTDPNNPKINEISALFSEYVTKFSYDDITQIKCLIYSLASDPKILARNNKALNKLIKIQIVKFTEEAFGKVTSPVIRKALFYCEVAEQFQHQRLPYVAYYEKAVHYQKLIPEELETQKKIKINLLFRLQKIVAHHHSKVKKTKVETESKHSSVKIEPNLVEIETVKKLFRRVNAACYSEAINRMYFSLPAAELSKMKLDLEKKLRLLTSPESQITTTSEAKAEKPPVCNPYAGQQQGGAVSFFNDKLPVKSSIKPGFLLSRKSS